MRTSVMFFSTLLEEVYGPVAKYALVMIFLEFCHYVLALLLAMRHEEWLISGVLIALGYICSRIFKMLMDQIPITTPPDGGVPYDDESVPEGTLFSFLLHCSMCITVVCRGRKWYTMCEWWEIVVYCASGIEYRV